MITSRHGFIIRHLSGRYLKSKWEYPVQYPGGGLGSVSTYRLVAEPLDADVCSGACFFSYPFADRSWQDVADQFVFVPRPVCGCCGACHHHTAPLARWGDAYRCAKHRDRNPCAIEGCERTRAAGSTRANDRTLCSHHWRMFCPPRSGLRRCYHRFFRLAKRQGWTPELEHRFDRFWAGLVNRARRGRVADLDLAEISEMFGWAA